MPAQTPSFPQPVLYQDPEHTCPPAESPADRSSEPSPAGPRGSLPEQLSVLAGPALAPGDRVGTQLSARFRGLLPGADQPAVTEGTRERTRLHLQCRGGRLPIWVSPGPESPGDRGCAQGGLGGDRPRGHLCGSGRCGSAASVLRGTPPTLVHVLSPGQVVWLRLWQWDTAFPFICAEGARGGAFPMWEATCAPLGGM